MLIQNRFKNNSPKMSTSESHIISAGDNRNDAEGRRRRRRHLVRY